MTGHELFMQELRARVRNSILAAMVIVSVWWYLIIILTEFTPFAIFASLKLCVSVSTLIRSVLGGIAALLTLKYTSGIYMQACSGRIETSGRSHVLQWAALSALLFTLIVLVPFTSELILYENISLDSVSVWRSCLLLVHSITTARHLLHLAQHPVFPTQKTDVWRVCVRLVDLRAWHNLKQQAIQTALVLLLGSVCGLVAYVLMSIMSVWDVLVLYKAIQSLIPLYCYILLLNLLPQLLVQLLQTFLLKHYAFSFAPARYSSVSQNTDTLYINQILYDQSQPLMQCYALWYLHEVCVIGTRQERAPVFTLSQPGGHARAWHCVRDCCVQLISASVQEAMQTAHTLKRASPLLHTQHIAHMSVTPTNAHITPVPVTDTLLVPPYARNLMGDQKASKSTPIVNSENRSRVQLAEDLFLKIHELHWAINILSAVCVHSVKEDEYGIVQSDLPALLITLLQTRAQFEQLVRLLCLGQQRVLDASKATTLCVHNALQAMVNCYTLDVCLRVLSDEKERSMLRLWHGGQ